MCVYTHLTEVWSQIPSNTKIRQPVQSRVAKEMLSYIVPTSPDTADASIPSSDFN